MKKADRAVTAMVREMTSGQGFGKLEASAKGTHMVMVVDDSSTMRAIIGKELEAEGYSVITFSDGLEALSSLHWMPTPPDLITLDIDMPRMDGFACCEKLREMESSGLFGDVEIRTPVLFVSANDTFVNRSRGFHLGSLQFISKPFVRGDIAAAVSRVLRPQATYVGMNALVIDDNQGVRKMVASYLEQIGLTVFEAENGKIAYDLLSQYIHRIDLAIVDFDMPVMRGDECIHLARQLPGAEHLPMLSLSGSGESDAVLRMFRVGATDYLVKPFIVEELLARVQVHLQLRRHFCHLRDLNLDLYDKAVNDGLTGLRNKRFFLEAFEEMFASALRIQTNLCCLFFDLDHFKQVNDTCGHLFGDYVLEHIGTLVKSAVRCGDLNARYGGEEFVVALPGTDLAGAEILAEKIRVLIEAYQFSDQGQQWPVTVSIGVASLQDHQPATALELLQQADQALYRAKEKGRNRVESSSS